MANSKRDTGKNSATPRRAGPRNLDLEALRVGSTKPRLGRMAGAADDQWSGTADGDTFADTDPHAAQSDFVDDDTLTDRDVDIGEVTSRDTMRELVGRDTLLDLSAAALAQTGDPTFDEMEPFSGDRTLDDDGPFPDEDTFNEPTSGNRGR